MQFLRSKPMRLLELALGLGAVCILAVYLRMPLKHISLHHHPQQTTQERVQEPSETDSEKMKRILHGTITQKLENGQLPIAPDSKSYSLWKDDPLESPCVDYKTRFGVGLPIVRLVSYPCSGNTWTRYLLEATTGIFTGSVYTDMTLYNAGFLGEVGYDNNGRTIVQKTHQLALFKRTTITYQERFQATSSMFPAILLIRNPAKALISYWKFIKSGDHTKQISDNMFNQDAFHNFVDIGIAQWESIIMDRLMWSTAPVYVLYYEDLLVDPATNLRKVLRFLGVPLDEDRLSCVSSHLTGRFKRQGNKDVNPYTQKEKILLSISTTRVNTTLQLLGYSPLPSYM